MIVERFLGSDGDRDRDLRTMIASGGVLERFLGSDGDRDRDLRTILERPLEDDLEVDLNFDLEFDRLTTVYPDLR
jgi:hypothetical protein